MKGNAVNVGQHPSVAIFDNLAAGVAINVTSTAGIAAGVGADRCPNALQWRRLGLSCTQRGLSC